MNPRSGDFFVQRTPGWGGWVIRTVTQSWANHAGIYIGGGRIVEALPSGAAISPMPEGAVWAEWPLTYDESQRVVHHALALVGTPYSWLDVAAVGIGRLTGWQVSGAVRRRLGREDRMMCSQLVDADYMRAGINLFNDGRPVGGVAPGDLEFLMAKRGRS